MKYFFSFQSSQLSQQFRSFSPDVTLHLQKKWILLIWTQKLTLLCHILNHKRSSTHRFQKLRLRYRKVKWPAGFEKCEALLCLSRFLGGVWGWMTFWVLTARGSSNNKVLPGRQSPFINTFVNVAEKNLTLWKIPKSQLLIIMMVFFYMKNILLISIKKLIYKSLGWASCWGEFKKCVNELWSPCRTWVIVNSHSNRHFSML